MRTFLGQLILLATVAASVAIPTTNQVLVLSTTITTGISVPSGFYEGAAILGFGLVPTVVTPAQWATMTTAQFASFRAIVLGRFECTNNLIHP